MRLVSTLITLSPLRTKYLSIIILKLSCVLIVSIIWCKIWVSFMDTTDTCLRLTPYILQSKSSLSLVGSKSRDLILLVFRDSTISRANLQFFVNHAFHNRADFIFVVQGKLKTNYTLPIPNKPNIRIIHRNNNCQDLGAYKKILTDQNMYKNYSRFILLNGSVRGPFFPLWLKLCWSDIFFSLLSNTVKLVGTTFNCVPFQHVQSMILATDRIGLDLILPELYCFGRHQDAVSKGELRITRAILRGGFAVDVMMSAFRVDGSPWNCTYNDPYWDKWYFGINIHPYEVIFPKVNRRVQEELIDLYTAWHDKSIYNSNKFCSKFAGVPELG